jgi:hypothetical protein
VFDELLRREAAERDDLAGGEASRHLGDRPLWDNLKGPPWVAGLEGTQTRGWWPSRRGRRRCGHGDVDAAAVLGRWCGCPFPVRRHVNARARACAGVRARRVNGTARLGVGRKGGDAAGTAAELGPAPWVAAGKATAVGTSARARKLRLVARRALGNQEGGAPSPATACAKHLTTARSWRRGRQRCGGEARRNKRDQRSSLAFRVGVRVCWGARSRESVVPARERERAGAGS